MTVDSPACACCGVEGHATVDHRVPRGMGGDNTAANRQKLCYRCNQIKGRLEQAYCIKWRKAKTEGRREELVRELLARWEWNCRSHSHGAWLQCRCPACLNAPVLV